MFWRNKNKNHKTIIGTNAILSFPQKELEDFLLRVVYYEYAGKKYISAMVFVRENEAIQARKKLTFEPNPEYLENTLERINKRIVEELFAPNKEKVNINKILEEEIKILEEYSKYVVDGEEGIVSVSGN